MMNRGQKLSILQSMSDENLQHALEAVGIDCGDQDEYGEGNANGSSIDTWKSLDVSVPGGGKLPPIANKNVLFKVAQERPIVRDQLGLSMPGEEEELMSSTGLV